MTRVDGRGGVAPSGEKHCSIRCQCESDIWLSTGLFGVSPSATLKRIFLSSLTSGQGSYPERTYGNDERADSYANTENLLGVLDSQMSRHHYGYLVGEIRRWESKAQEHYSELLQVGHKNVEDMSGLDPRA